MGSVVSPGWRRCRGGWWCRSMRCKRACRCAPPRWTGGCHTGSRSLPRPCTSWTGCPSSPGGLHSGWTCWTSASAPRSAHRGEGEILVQRWPLTLSINTFHYNEAYRAAHWELVTGKEAGPAPLLVHDAAGPACGQTQALTGQLHSAVLTFGHVDGTEQRLDDRPAARSVTQTCGMEQQSYKHWNKSWDVYDNLLHLSDSWRWWQAQTHE